MPNRTKLQEQRAAVVSRRPSLTISKGHLKKYLLNTTTNCGHRYDQVESKPVTVNKHDLQHIIIYYHY